MLQCTMMQGFWNDSVTLSPLFFLACLLLLVHLLMTKL